MLHYLLLQLVDQYPFLNLFRYITFRTGGAIFTSLFFCLIFGGRIIAWLKSMKPDGQPIRADGPESHLLTKKGTPTMGGIMMIMAILLSTILWADVTNPFIWVLVFVTIAFGFIGFLDDYAKLTKKSHIGVRGKTKLMLEIFAGLIAVYLISINMPEDKATHLALPFFKTLLINMFVLFYIFAAFVIVGASNSVNLTDGLDGLAIVPVIIAVCCFGLISYLVGHFNYSNYLQLHHIPKSGEVAVVCGAIMGAGLGFLWYNAPPAQVFMGDTGSLSLGALLGTMAVITKHEIVLAIIGGLFVMETLSVIIQVSYYKRTGKRVFLMSPIHHHFEKKGWSETKVVIRFWIIAIIFALIGLSTLKLR